MLGNHIWILHLYSCLGVCDLEILYEKMSRLGLILCRSNSWADCYKVEKPIAVNYKVIPRIRNCNLSIDNDKWKLIGKNNKHYIFSSNKKDEFTDVETDESYDNIPVSNAAFLFVFPICFLYFFERFHLIENGFNRGWLNLMFVGTADIIYIGYMGAFISELVQKREFLRGIKRIEHKHSHFWFYFVLSCIINILQAVLLCIVIYKISEL